MSLSELRKKHQFEDTLSLVDGAPWLEAVCHRHRSRFPHVTRGRRSAVKHVICILKRRTNQFANTFSHAEPRITENWLQAFAFAGNQII